jgi:hypothetical protein
MAIGRPSAGISAMPRVETTVDSALAAEFRAIARQRKVSMSTVVREFIYDAARSRFGLDLEDKPPTKSSRK